MDNYWEGTSIRLRGVDAADAEAHHQFNLTSDYGLIDQVYPPGSLAPVQEWASRKSQAGFDDQTFSFQMESIDTGELVGGIATHDCNQRTGVLSYGLHVFGNQRGKGYAKEAICLVLRYYFQELRYQKANVGIYAINEPSIRLHEALGFQLEGRMRRTAYTRGTHVDLLWYGLTVEEFRDRHAQFWRPAPGLGA